MNLRAEVALMLAAPGAAPSCLFFRPADVSRLDACIASVLQEGQSLALSARAEAALDHYADLLIHRLRCSGCPVEIFFPASTASLVARFEERVARLSVQQAMREGAARPECIWLVHDAGALSTAELQLLTRLVSSFPGAGVRVVLLFGPSDRSRRGFESLGRRFARWDLVPPNADDMRVMQTLARSEGHEAVVSELLAQLPAPARPSALRNVQDVAALAPTAMGQKDPGVQLPRPRRRWWGRRAPAASLAPPSAPAGGVAPQAFRPWLRALGLATLLLAGLAAAWFGLSRPGAARPWPQPVRQWLQVDAPAPLLPAASPASYSEQRT